MIEDPNFVTKSELEINLKQEINDYNKFDERYKMVIVVRNDLKMSTGKIAAQVGHGGKIADIK